MKTNDSLWEPIVQKFILPFPQNLELDSNSIIFYGDRCFDTSFLIHLHKSGNEIDGTYYRVLPDYHRNLYDVRTGEKEVLYFDGCGFKVDMNSWHTIKMTAAMVLANDADTAIKSGCCDGDKYGLFYNGVKRFKGNQNDNSSYESFYILLKDILLDTVIKMRQPIRVKK